ncbi:MAG: hypothetical protein U1C56_01630 [Candidatus Curtissbacteria bacterium]|nr:hypothetical protein [Candidatus Curtissbacteria bacterium]
MERLGSIGALGIIVPIIILVFVFAFVMAMLDTFVFPLILKVPDRVVEVVFWIFSLLMVLVLSASFGWLYGFFDYVSWLGLKPSVGTYLPVFLGIVYVIFILAQYFYCLFLKKGGS